MNRELLRKVADSIRTEDSLGYNQGNWFCYEDVDEDDQFCGTCACVAGHAIFVEEGLAKLAKSNDDLCVSSRASELLELNVDQARALFAGTPQGLVLAHEFNIPYEHADKLFRRCDDDNKTWMARVLETIAEHGS